MGNLCWLLGIGIDRNHKNQTISSQATYIQKIMEHFGMEDTNLLHTHHPWPQPEQVTVTSQQLRHRGDQAHTIQGGSQLLYVL